MAQHHLAEHAVADPALGEHVGGARADRRHVLPGVVRCERLDLAAHGARRLERVVQRGELGAQQLEAAVAVGEPQVLVGGDVAEVPHQRAHDRRVHALELLVVERRDQRQRSLARGAHREQHLRGVGGEGVGLYRAGCHSWLCWVTLERKSPESG